jgi:16S rRNA (guanine527-N7)-methyltransferase
LLEQGAKEMNVELMKAQVQQLDRFAILIKKWNKGMNLVSRQDIQRLVPRHLLDSLAAAPHIDGNTLLDVGTGPGLPGIVLAIAKPEVSVTLWERMTRRVRFLQLACRELGLNNVQVQEQDLYNPKSLGSADLFDAIVARAVAPVESLWPVLEQHLSAHGQLIVYSHVAGPDREQPETPRVDGLVEYPYQVPGLTNEHFLQLVRKNAGPGNPASTD